MNTGGKLKIFDGKIFIQTESPELPEIERMGILSGILCYER